VFSNGSLDALRPMVEKVVTQLLDEFIEQVRQGPADFNELVSEELPVITIGTWMGLPESDYGLLRSLTHDQAHTQELFPSASQLALSDAATAQLREYFAELIRERRKRPGDDPVSSWIRTWDEREPDRAAADEAVHSLAIFMILAALETTSYVLSSAVRLLLEHPDQMERLRSDPELIPSAVDETLRYDSPIHMISRIAPADTELGGVVVQAGEMVQLMVGCAHHDAAQYPEPHVFDVGRKPTGHLAFGAGIHYCLGNALARLEAATLITELLKRPIRPYLSAPPQWASRVAFRRMTSLQLAVS